MAVSGGGEDQKRNNNPGGAGEPGRKQLAELLANHTAAEHADFSFEHASVDPYNNHFATFGESKNWQSSSPSSSSTRQMLGDDGDHNSSSRTRRRRRSSFITVPFVQKIEWGSLWDKSKEWMRSPLNMALLVWIVAVGVSGAILFMVMTGMLNRALPKKSQRDTWFEVNNQILNALFTLMCLYQHPRRFYHLALLCRWRAGDMLQLRQQYCKDGACKPDERKHMAVVILLLHLNCFAQYALCGLNLGYSRPRRPPVGVGLTISVAICAPAVAGLYNNLSPLGKDYEAQPQPDEESQQPLEKRYSFAPRQGQGRHEWVGGPFDLFWDDISLAYLSVFCSCCVFGWNMSRLGLGNMYVHIVTFILFCLAPFFIFNLAAINIDNETVRDALGLGGIFLCVLGLLYGGFWRIQMRNRFGLPANHACCGKPDLTDCLQWLCCYSCSLAQEVRTADAYDLVLKHDHDSSSSTSMHHHHPTLEEELSTMQQPLRFAGVFATTPPVPPAAARSVNDGATVPPSVSVIHKQ